jgi:replication factor C large subunit
MLLSQKYAPTKMDSIAGNEECKKNARQWILSWLRGARQKPLLVHGPTGTGKTALAYAMAAEYSLDLIEMNAGDLRDAESVGRMLAGASGAGTLSGRQKLILIDDADALQKADRGGAGAIASVLKSSSAPIIVTCTDMWEKKMAQIRPLCQQAQLRRISPSSVRKVLRAIADAEKIEIKDDALEKISSECSGDLRSAINDMQTGVPGMRDREKDMFDRMGMVFRAETYSEARQASWGDADHDFVKLWIDENIPLAYSGADMARAYNFLSRADMFDGRIIRRQYWGFLRYSSDLMTAGVALSADVKHHGFIRYQFPDYLRQRAAVSERRAKRIQSGGKIGARTHSSWREGYEQSEIIADIIRRVPNAAAHYRMDEDDVAFLLGISAAEAKKYVGEPEAAAEKAEAPDKKKAAKKEPAPKAAPKKETPAPKAQEKQQPVKKGGLADFM